MSIEELVQRLTKELLQHLTIDDNAAREAHDRAVREFEAAYQRVDDDLRERQRIRDIADLIDAEDALYDEAIAALDRGDSDRALPLLHRAAQAGIGEATWLLAGLLEERGQTADAITWYRRAAADGDPRADAKLADLYSRRPGYRTFISHKLWPGTTVEHPAAKPDDRVYGLEAFSIVQEAWPADSHLASWLAGPEGDFGFLYLPTDLSAAPTADPYQVLKTPHHGAGASTDELSSWASNGVFAVEGVSDECAVRRWLDRYGHVQVKLVVLGGQVRPADTGLDVIASSLNGQVRVWEVKIAKHLRQRLSTYPRTFWARALAAPLTSWQIERGAAREPIASDVMTPLASLTTLTPGTTVHQAMGQALEADAHALPVCDEQQVVGVVTLADLARCLHDSRGVLSIERVETLMRPPAAVEMAAPLSAVRALMAREGTALVVVTGPGGMTVGCVTAQSFLAGEPGGRDTARPGQPGARVHLLRPDSSLVKGCVPV